MVNETSYHHKMSSCPSPFPSEIPHLIADMTMFLLSMIQLPNRIYHLLGHFRHFLLRQIPITDVDGIADTGEILGAVCILQLGCE